MSGISLPIAGGTARGSRAADREPAQQLRQERSSAATFGSLLAGKLGTRREPTAAPTATNDGEGGGALTAGATAGTGEVAGPIVGAGEIVGGVPDVREALIGDQQPQASQSTVGDAHANIQSNIQASTQADSQTGILAGSQAAGQATTQKTGGESDGSVAEGASDEVVQGADGGATAGVATTVEPEAASSPIAAATAANAPYRGMDGIVPELRDRLQRVMDRMREEHGVQVSVVETFRPQVRQDALHAQGRSAPGNVVTWTRNSRHTQGRAVDVMVNGGYTDSRAFATLQQVAREEGLHTLGMRDPGHLELPASGTNSVRQGGVDLSALTRLATGSGATVEDVEITPRAHSVAQASTPEQVVRPARVAQVAAVASVATVATVARVATVGVRAARSSAPTVAGTAHSREGDARGGTAPETVAASARPAAASGGTMALGVAAGAEGQGAGGSGAFTPSRQGERRRQDSDSTDANPVRGEAADAALVVGGEGSRDPGGQHAAGGGRATPIMASNAADSIARVDRIDQLRDGSAARPLSQLTLSLDDSAGGADRIRVGLRGNQVGAVLELSDSALHDRVSSRLGELQGALEQRGLETDSLRVRRAGGTGAETLDMSRVASAAMDRGGARGASHGGANPGGDQQTAQQYTSQRDRDGRPHRDAAHDQPDRHQPRRQPEEEPR